MAVTVPEMLKMSQTQLDDLFTQSPSAKFPSGEGKGTAIVAPGTTYTQDIANFINHLHGREKFSIRQRGLAKQNSAFGLNAIIAKVYKDRAGSIKRSASSSIIPRLRSSRIGSR
jgi:hypothetical protein